ncbi:hypothetical protein KDL01_32770 [Actinospica durhamensis]|uniref:Uncharacterized protein n=1 Tax=Actinospica durhamensis TaxID=1508375 RepID=A0A941ITU0_9ACTN|nr:hypothetical protein [Actinospica durhamensis]MBR7838092.1 hypothetical protein [Actinospica durhamensis]
MLGSSYNAFGSGGDASGHREPATASAQRRLYHLEVLHREVEDYRHGVNRKLDRGDATTPAHRDKIV